MQVLVHYLNSLSAEDRERFAKACGTSVGYLRKASSTGQRLGESLCVRISIESGGAVSCTALRPDVDWSIYQRWLTIEQASERQAA